MLRHIDSYHPRRNVALQIAFRRMLSLHTTLPLLASPVAHPPCLTPGAMPSPLAPWTLVRSSKYARSPKEELHLPPASPSNAPTAGDRLSSALMIVGPTYRQTWSGILAEKRMALQLLLGDSKFVPEPNSYPLTAKASKDIKSAPQSRFTGPPQPRSRACKWSDSIVDLPRRRHAAHNPRRSVLIMEPSASASGSASFGPHPDIHRPTPLY